MYPYRLLWGLFLLALLGIAPTAQAQEHGTLAITVTDLAPTSGTLFISIFNTPEGFPGEYKNAYKVQQVPVGQQTETVEIPGLPYDEYAIGIWHDRNDNRRFDTNALGIPTEGYGASNDANNMLGPPDYADARFRLNSPHKTLEIRCRN